jgi:glycosylphosphatidylinositol transamidase
MANSRTIKGNNAYAILSSPRAPGTEAMVISASWLSRTGDGDGTLNLRGVSTVLALAAYLKGYSLWAKDIIFVISDGYMDGMHAWLSSYHGTTQSNLIADQLNLSSGVIWTALNIDYPGHSFSHLGIFYEGLNGRLPNQDLLNSFHHISRYTGGVPITVYDHLDPREFPGRNEEFETISRWIPGLLQDQPDLRTYAYQARNVLRHMGYQAHGRASGVHGLFHQFRIDAFTLFAVPATGPHGFHAIGRIVESTLRTTNNLLERLHASFFFYIMTGPDQFLQIGNYLPSAVLISIAMMFGGLRKWVDAAWIQDESRNDTDEKEVGNKEPWIRRKRPVLNVLGIMFMTHVLGGLLFGIVTRPWFIENSKILSPLLFLAISVIPLPSLLLTSPEPKTTAPIPILLQSLSLCFASTVVSITTVLNFSLAAFLAILLGVPLSFASPSGGIVAKLVKYAFVLFVALDWLLFSQAQMLKSIMDWEILGIWFAPFICLIYVPLLLQAGIVCLLPLDT